MFGDALARWWAHRKLRLGRCAWCHKVLPDSGPHDALYRACSEECAREVELHRMV